MMKRFFLFLAVLLTALPAAHALDTNAANAIFQQGRFDQNLGAQVPLDAVFRDETGEPTALRSVLGQRPAILVLGYHECPMLCSLVLGGLVESMNDMRVTSGTGFDLIDVSISPADTPAQAAHQKRVYFKRYCPPRRGRGLAFPDQSRSSDDPPARRRRGFPVRLRPHEQAVRAPERHHDSHAGGQGGALFFRRDFRSRRPAKRARCRRSAQGRFAHPGTAADVFSL